LPLLNISFCFFFHERVLVSEKWALNSAFRPALETFLKANETLLATVLIQRLGRVSSFEDWNKYPLWIIRIYGCLERIFEGADIIALSIFRSHRLFSSQP